METSLKRVLWIRAGGGSGRNLTLLIFTCREDHLQRSPKAALIPSTVEWWLCPWPLAHLKSAFRPRETQVSDDDDGAASLGNSDAAPSLCGGNVSGCFCSLWWVATSWPHLHHIPSALPGERWDKEPLGFMLPVLWSVPKERWRIFYSSVFWAPVWGLSPHLTFCVGQLCSSGKHRDGGWLTQPLLVSWSEGSSPGAMPAGAHLWPDV